MKFLLSSIIILISLHHFRCEQNIFQGMDEYEILNSNYKDLVLKNDKSKSNSSNQENKIYSSFMELGIQSTNKSLATLKSQAELAERESDKIIDYFKSKLENESKNKNLRALRFKQNDLFRNNELTRLAKKRAEPNIPSNINEMLNTIKME